jgi:hypothetical protein
MRKNALSNIGYLVPSSINTYTLPILSNYQRFKILNQDVNTKTFIISNVSLLDTEITIRINNIAVSTLTFPTNVAWKDAVTPVFAAGKIYYIFLITDDGGVSYQGTWTGSW